MESRVRNLRDILDKSQRATDDVLRIVDSTDAQLADLHAIMAPIQERTQCLSNAHHNLSRCVTCVRCPCSVLEGETGTRTLAREMRKGKEADVVTTTTPTRLDIRLDLVRSLVFFLFFLCVLPSVTPPTGRHPLAEEPFGGDDANSASFAFI